MHRRVVQLVVAAAGVALTAYVVAEMANARGISLDFESGIPDQLPKDPARDGRDAFTAGPRYPFHFQKGFRECLDEYLVPRPYKIINRLKMIDAYAMDAQLDGFHSCERQIQDLCAQFGSTRVLRALRWKYCTCWDWLEVHAQEVQLTLGAIVGSVVIFSVVRLANRLQRAKRKISTGRGCR
jgi:hypothetical protein